MAPSPPPASSSGSSSSSKPSPESPLARAAEAWRQRAARQNDGAVVAAPQAVEQAVALYRQAVEDDPDDLELHARLLEALIFQGEYVAQDEEARRQRFTAAKERAEESLDRLARTLATTADELDRLEPGERARRLLQAGDRQASELAGLHFWAAVAWGQWGDTVGRLKAARSGVADRLRHLAGTALALDETYAGAGPHRFLGRLHSEAPKVPFFTGWVDRGRAVEHLERARKLAPEEPDNLLFLAEALLDHFDERTPEARRLLEELADREPRADHLLEDARALEQARQRLAELPE